MSRSKKPYETEYPSVPEMEMSQDSKDLLAATQTSSSSMDVDDQQRNVESFVNSRGQVCKWVETQEITKEFKAAPYVLKWW
jgi:hypothetical protein